jgi:Crp-like helix-turn-helix domain
VIVSDESHVPVPQPHHQAQHKSKPNLSRRSHVNRVIQQLRADGLVTWSDKRIVLEDWARLQEVAEFDPTFLNLDNEPW